ncbi:MAG: hypothetical protein J2P46_19365 [Zavarzinella sp.]|nr:hypothetical protein [Zavarzinella sp.]
MSQRTGYLKDQSSDQVASFAVVPVGDRYEGTITLARTPLDLRRLFDEYEELVEGQVFSRLNNIEERIAARRLRVVFDDGTESAVEDLQVYPSTGAVSFAARESKAQTGLAQTRRVSTPGGDAATHPTRAG